MNGCPNCGGHIQQIEIETTWMGSEHREFVPGPVVCSNGCDLTLRYPPKHHRIERRADGGGACVWCDLDLRFINDKDQVYLENVAVCTRQRPARRAHIVPREAPSSPETGFERFGRAIGAMWRGEPRKRP